MVKVTSLLKQAFRAAAKPYRVEVIDLENDNKIVHRAWTQADALEWMRCYGRDFGPHIVRITTRTGRLVASRATLA